MVNGVEPGAQVESFYTRVIVGSRVYNSPVRVTSPEWLEPVFAEKIALVMDTARELGEPLMIWETFRSQTLQETYFRRGVTDLEKVGVHHYGLACDLVKNIDGVPSWKGDWGFLGDLATRFGLVWGGQWKHPVDCCHLQRIRVQEQPQLFAGTWYPDDKYVPYDA